MTTRFDLKLEFKAGTVYWFKAKGRYWVRIDTEGRRSCECDGWVKSGCKAECKHIKKSLKLLKEMKRL